MATNWFAKASKTVKSLSPKEVSVDAKVTEAYPGVFAFLHPEGEEDGAEREPCRVQIFVDGGDLRAALHDPEAEASLFVTLARPEEAFRKLQKALEAEEPDWRAWRRSGKRKKAKGR